MQANPIPQALIKVKRLSELTTLGIGGVVDLYFEIHSIQEMEQAIKQCLESKIPFFVLGKGSNCLFDDRGFRGAILHNKIDFFEELGSGRFHVGAGFSFSLLGVKTARAGFGGLEFASGIPASVGGAIFMNAGANGFETATQLQSVEFIDASGTLKTLQKEELSFSYRTSSFQKMTGAIVGATFQLYPFENARKKQLDIILYRTNTQPYGDKSAGCVFRNPENFSAGQLIDKAGLKGVSIGGATVSSLHANFLINQKNASSVEFKALIEAIQKKVLKDFKIELESEIRIIPETF